MSNSLLLLPNPLGEFCNFLLFTYLVVVAAGSIDRKMKMAVRKGNSDDKQLEGIPGKPSWKELE